MKRLNIVLKLLILVVSYISCGNLPLKAIRFDSYTCCEVQNITHNLQLDDEITNRLNRICWNKNPRDFLSKFYLVAVRAESPDEGLMVTAPFTSSDCRVTYFNGGKFELEVREPNKTWLIICTFSETAISGAQLLFNTLYHEYPRRLEFLKTFEVREIRRKGPNHNTTGSQYSSRTFIYRENCPENNTSFILTPSRDSVRHPVLVISCRDFTVSDVDVNSVAVSLKVRDDEDLYVLYFDNFIVALEFVKYITPYARRGK